MIKKENRLKKNKHFNYIYKNGLYVSTEALSLVYIKSKFKHYKVGFSVSNKIGKAVMRNKIKRRLRESFNQITEKIDRRYNYIFIAKPKICESNFLQINQTMTQLIKKANLFNEKYTN